MINSWRNLASFTCGILTAFSITGHAEGWLFLVLLFITPWPAVARLGGIAIEDIYWFIAHKRSKELVNNK